VMPFFSSLWNALPPRKADLPDRLSKGISDLCTRSLQERHHVDFPAYRRLFRRRASPRRWKRAGGAQLKYRCINFVQHAKIVSVPSGYTVGLHYVPEREHRWPIPNRPFQLLFSITSRGSALLHVGADKFASAASSANLAGGPKTNPLALTALEYVPTWFSVRANSWGQYESLFSSETLPKYGQRITDR